MSWLFEQPVIIVLLGVALILGLGAAWSASGRQELLYGIAAVLVLITAGLVVEKMVVTDGEAIRTTLQQIARDVQSNNQRAVIGHVYSGAPVLKQEAEAKLPSFHFTECRITRINKVEIDRNAEPRSADVEFNLIATATVRQSGFEGTDTVP